MPAITLANHVIIGDELALSWGDGTENFIPLEKLRKACPCAVCQGEPDALGRVLKPKVIYSERSFKLLAITQTGGYALNLKWGDGHSTGIYTFDLLRSL